jgi:hypothetical protein
MWIFFIFQSSKIHFSLTSIVCSLSPLGCRLSSDRCCHAVIPFHTFFPLSQDELTASASTFDNALSCCLPFWVETEALNPHHRRRLSSPDSLTLIIYYYKKIISTLTTFRTTQLRLHFTSFIIRAPHHQNFTHHHRSLSPLSHVHRPSTQWHTVTN